MSYKAWTFIKRDFIIESSYKLNFILTFFNSLFPIISFFFVSKLINGAENISLDKYGGNYFDFALIGISFTRFFQLAVETFSSNIKRAQMAGCLEAILSSQTESKKVVLFSSLYSFLSAGIQLVFMFIVSFIFFKFDFSNTNVFATIISVFISIITFISLGIFSAAGTVIFKQGEPISWVFGTLSALLSGAVFPVTVLPSWLQYVSHVLPTTYALEAIRLSCLQNFNVVMLHQQLLILSLMALILFPLSLRTFEWAVERGKKDGTLMLY